MYTTITVLLIIASIFMILIVLVQNSKGGGLASNFQSNNQVMGVRKTNDFLDKATWTLAITILVLAISSSAFIDRGQVSTSATEMGSHIENVIDPTATPTFPMSEEGNTESSSEDIAE